MMSDLFLKDYDLNIIDFNELFTTDIQFEIIDSLYEFDLLEKSINNSSVKKFFLHWIILSICDKILKNKNKSLIYFNYTQLEDCELKKYYNETEILNFLNSNLRRVEKLLPIKIFISKFSIDYLSYLIDKNDGKAYTTINSMVNKLNSIDITKFTFSNIKKFTKRYELTFLNRDYFNRLSTKLLLIR
jgi:hypothetical protein|tara:strand:- start:89 stop:649 length:561 start_codon:yes stop_codon:yes gene_type:complete